MGFVGVLGQYGFVGVNSTGMCFENATSYPSVTHPNGDSIDTRYLGTNQQRGLTFTQLITNYDNNREDTFAEAFRTWGFSNVIAGSHNRYNHLNNNVHSTNGAHNNHLHAGDFPATNVFTII